MKIGRRRLFGLLAAPAVLSITGRLQPSYGWEFFNENDFTTENMRYRCVERILDVSYQWEAMYGTYPADVTPPVPGLFSRTSSFTRDATDAFKRIASELDVQRALRERERREAFIEALRTADGSVGQARWVIGQLEVSADRRADLEGSLRRDLCEARKAETVGRVL